MAKRNSYYGNAGNTFGYVVYWLNVHTVLTSMHRQHNAVPNLHLIALMSLVNAGCSLQSSVVRNRCCGDGSPSNVERDMQCHTCKAWWHFKCTGLQEDQKILGRAVSVQKANPTIRRLSEDRPLDARKLGHSSSREEICKVEEYLAVLSTAYTLTNSSYRTFYPEEGKPTSDLSLALLIVGHYGSVYGADVSRGFLVLLETLHANSRGPTKVHEMALRGIQSTGPRNTSANQCTLWSVISSSFMDRRRTKFWQLEPLYNMHTALQLLPILMMTARFSIKFPHLDCFLSEIPVFIHCDLGSFVSLNFTATITNAFMPHRSARYAISIARPILKNTGRSSPIAVSCTISKKSFSCNTLSVPNCHATRRKQKEGGLGYCQVAQKSKQTSKQRTGNNPYYGGDKVDWDDEGPSTRIDRFDPLHHTQLQMLYVRIY
ncbi:hypothetical protein CLF_102814 [Clonorchis sinensis]|uniref:Uncharacterized protein n=1 Tax=Clonorchis sinensis TaxID=79923 RepID=G7Y8K3_CLOSI|nr:hypothetical protein CLF_102814 [Clonorchis sinensis]